MKKRGKKGGGGSEKEKEKEKKRGKEEGGKGLLNRVCGSNKD
jgi:hypothetical protein